MKPSLRDYLTTVLAILVVFACGYGIGHQFGSRPAEPAPVASWETSVFERLDSELSLDASQREAIRGEIAASARKIEQVKGQARAAYRDELLGLHGRILPLLDEAQRERLKKSRAALQHSSGTGVSP